MCFSSSLTCYYSNYLHLWLKLYSNWALNLREKGPLKDLQHEVTEGGGLTAAACTNSRMRGIKVSVFY